MYSSNAKPNYFEAEHSSRVSITYRKNARWFNTSYWYFLRLQTHTLTKSKFHQRFSSTAGLSDCRWCNTMTYCWLSGKHILRTGFLYLADQKDTKKKQNELVVRMFAWRYFFSGCAVFGKSSPGVRRQGQQRQIEGEILRRIDIVTCYHRNRHRAHRAVGQGGGGVSRRWEKNSQTAVIPTWQPVLRISTLPCLWRSCPGMPHKTQCLQATAGCAHVTQANRKPQKRESDEKTRLRKCKWEISDREAEMCEYNPGINKAVCLLQLSNNLL